MDAQSIHVGLVGFGFAGRTFHAPVIRSIAGLRLVAVVQRNADDARTANPDAQLLRSVDELLRLDAIRLVVIATPNSTHFELARQCLLARRDVILDKPFTATYAEGAELVRLAKEQERTLSVYHNRRWDGDFKTVRELVNCRALGPILLYESHFDRYRPQLRAGAWREQANPGSGVLFDLGSHLIDQALVLFGKPDAVSADVRAEREGAAADDAFDVTLHYPNMRAHLRATTTAVRPGPRFLIHGREASYVKYGFDPQEEALKRGEMPGGASWGEESPEAWGTIYRAENDKTIERAVPTEAGNYRGYYENVRDAIRGIAELAVTSQQALQVMHILELARQSSDERRTISCA